MSQTRLRASEMRARGRPSRCAARATSGDRSSWRSIAWVDTALSPQGFTVVISDPPFCRKHKPTYVRYLTRIGFERTQLLGIGHRVPSQLAARQDLVGAHPP